MGIQRLQPQSSVIQPTKPNLVHTQINSSSQNTYYTIVNIIGKGKVSRISIAYWLGSSYSSNQYLKIRITVDNGTPVELSPNAGTPVLSVGGGNDIGRASVFDLIQEITFNSSVKIEMAQTWGPGGSTNLNGAVEYALV